MTSPSLGQAADSHRRSTLPGPSGSTQHHEHDARRGPPLPRAYSYSHSHSSTSPPTATSKMSTAIPIPRIHPPPPYPSSISSSSNNNPLSPSARSPTPSSLSSYRSHPYSRRSSNPSTSAFGDSLPRIHLPPPNSSAPFKHLDEKAPSRQRERERERERDIPPLSSLALASPPAGWEHSRPPAAGLARSPSDGPGAGANHHHSHHPHPHHHASSSSHQRGGGDRPPIHLPPLHSISRSPSQTTPSNSMPPPAVTSPTASSSSPGGHLPPPNQSLRPSYGLYEPSSSSASQPSWRHEERHSSSYPPPQASSPPLRSIHQAYSPPEQRYHHVPATAYYPASQKHGAPYDSNSALARSRSHSSASVNAGYRAGALGQGAADQDPNDGYATQAGQNRRVAHLLSEQKRRESINSGFQALRDVLPSSLPTDSKAIILRKAAQHIAHLESLLRRSNIPLLQQEAKNGERGDPRWASGGGGGGGGGGSGGEEVRDEEMMMDEDEEMARRGEFERDEHALRERMHDRERERIRVKRERGDDEWEEMRVEDVRQMRDIF